MQICTDFRVPWLPIINQCLDVFAALSSDTLASLSKGKEGTSVPDQTATSETNGHSAESPTKPSEEDSKVDVTNDVFKAEEEKPSTFADVYSDTDNESGGSGRYP